MDTQELSEIKKLLGEDPKVARNADAFAVDEIVQEVSQQETEPTPTEPEPKKPEEPAVTSEKGQTAADTPKKAQEPRKSRFHIIEAPLHNDPPKAKPQKRMQQDAAPQSAEKLQPKETPERKSMQARAELPKHVKEANEKSAAHVKKEQNTKEESLRHSKPPKAQQHSEKVVPITEEKRKKSPKKSKKIPTKTIETTKKSGVPYHLPDEGDAVPEVNVRALKKAEKTERKARQKAEQKARRAALEQAEEEIYHPCDPRVAERATARRIKSLGGRSMFVGIITLAATYISLAGGMGWPLPEMLDFTKQTAMVTLVLMVMQFITMLVGIDIIGMGIYALFSGTPDRKTILAAASLATIAHALVTILVPKWDQMLPYCCISILMLFASMQEEKGRLAARHFTVKAAMINEQPLGIYCHMDTKDGVRRITKVQVDNTTPFLTEIEKPDTVQNASYIYAPIALAAAIIFALISSIGQGVPSRFFWALAVLLSLSMPLGLVCASGKAHSRIARRLLKEGAALTGVRGAKLLRRGKQAVLEDLDLFPIGSVVIEGLRNYGKYDNEKLLAYVAAITTGAELGIGKIFADKLREQYGRPVRAHDILRYDSGGLSADIGADSVMVGTASFLTRLNVRLHDIAGVENGIFVVINNQVAGAFTLSYQPTAQTYSALHGLRRLRIKPLIVSRDFNITAAMVEGLFEMRSDSVAEVRGERIDLICDQTYIRNDTVCAIVSRDGITPYTHILQNADKLVHVVNNRLQFGILAGICGLLLGFFLVHSYSIAAVSPKNLLLYIFLWYIPAFFVGLAARK